MDEAGAGATRAARRHPLPSPGSIGRVIRAFSGATIAIGALVIALGILSAALAPPEFYTDVFSGYDPPFLVVAGVMLIVLAPWIRERTPFAWLFSLLAPALTVSAAAASPNVFSVGAAVASSVFVASVYRYRSGFYRGLSGASGATELAVIVAGLLSVLFGTVGSRWLGTQFNPPVRGWDEALYFTVTTISTNGSTIEPATNDARLFVVVLVLLGVGTFLSAVVVLFLPFIQRRLNVLTARLERAQMQELEQHIVVCGASPEALATARSLREAGARCVILATDSPALDLLRGEGFRTHLGDPAVEDDLKAVGIDRARAVVVAGASDAENLLAVITARGLQPSVRIIALASSDSTLPKLRRAGANEAMSVVGVAAQLMSSAALGGPRSDAPGPGPVAG